MTAAESPSTKFIVNALEIVLVVSAAFLLAHYVATFLDDKSRLKISAYQTPVAKDMQQFSQSYDFKNMFFPELTAGEDKIVKVRAAESSLDIRLFGLRADGNGMGSVIYKIGAQEQQNVRVGEQMADKIKLLAVFNDRIEINNNGRFETVTFGKVNSRLRGLLEPTPPPEQNENVKTDQAQPPFLTTSYFKPVKNENGVTAGFILQPEYAAMLSGTAFMLDDVIMEINGERVHNYENLSEALEGIRFGQKVNMTIERRGNKQSMSFMVPAPSTANR
ncbi:Glutaryl-CoA dehydrogenase protein [Candidatus Micropelagos thuwalensis]|uniref:Glutaryl-CoA dehydrogenase protein n=1 Tax=Candidatus Micropelagius thuwalensis TaxID=1397666 RepID=U2WBE0_9PROT|nr:type II secretion system protein N [Candidatus Micropelagos thuwalensis]ERL46874.1 Glutaryl-CoA dehydrogenase protein [Candidatus Micropelagos thuwalensis]